MKLLLARHGNTFEPGEAATIVGRAQDLKLTAEGETQAARLARFCLQPEFMPDAIYCGALLRTRRMAEIVSDICKVPAPIVDDGLTEIDYGAWGGLTMAEVRQRFGDAEADAWEHDGVTPIQRGWLPDAATIRSGVEAFANDARASGHQTVLAISSNGVLRFFAYLVPGLFETLKSERALKVATGNLCCLDWTGQNFEAVFWNRKPDRQPG